MSQNKTIDLAIKKLVELGFKVFHNEDKSYLHYSDGKNMGYLQKTNLASEGFIDLTTVNRSSSEFGTGKKIVEAKHLDDLTKETLIKALEANSSLPSNLVYKNSDEWEKECFSKDNSTIYFPEADADISVIKSFEVRGLDRTIDVIVTGMAYYNDQGNHFRVFNSETDAKNWIKSGDDSLVISDFDNDQDLDDFLLKKAKELNVVKTFFSDDCYFFETKKVVFACEDSFAENNAVNYGVFSKKDFDLEKYLEVELADIELDGGFLEGDDVSSVLLSLQKDVFYIQQMHNLSSEYSQPQIKPMEVMGSNGDPVVEQVKI